ncbi:MAG: (2Fe-2S) ferredoxin domain-containing protein [Elainellaceae cyanobacterium]
MSYSSTSSPIPKQRRCVMVCDHRSCLRNGSEAVYDAFQSAKSSEHNFFVMKSGCTGQCSSGPTVRVMPDETWYCQLKPEDVHQIVTQHFQHNTPVESLLHPRFHPQATPRPRTSESQPDINQPEESSENEAVSLEEPLPLEADPLEDPRPPEAD